MTISSMGTPGNPLVGGRSTLIRDAIRSKNYVAGVSGWSINSDGTAEFNGVTIRGSGVFGNPTGERVEITNTGVIRIYNAANQLVVQLDDAGLLVQDPTTGTYAQTTLTAGYTVQALHPPNVVGHTFGAALIYGDSDPSGDAWMRVESPQIDGGDVARIQLYGENASISEPSNVRLIADRVTVGQGQNGIGWGPVARAFSAADSAAVTAETVVLTATSFTYLPGRAYRASFGNLISSSNVNARAGFRLRKTNAAGQILGFTGIDANSPVAGNFCHAAGEFYFKNSTAAGITAFIVLTLQNFDGGANTTQQRVSGGNRFLFIEDCGDLVTHDWATDLV